MIKRLRAKFVLVNMILVAIMLVVIFTMVFNFNRMGMVYESIRVMEFIGSEEFNHWIPEEYVEKINLPYFVIDNPEPGVYMTSGGGYYDLNDQAFLDDVLNQALEYEYDTGRIPEYNLRFLRTGTGAAAKIVFVDISSERSMIRSMMMGCLLVGIMAFGIFWILSFFLARWAVKPVELAWKQQKQFIADASHELKTPITVILTNAELLQGEDCTDQDRNQFSGSILLMARQMRHLVEQLLTLTRMDNNASNMEMSELDFSALAEESLLPFEPLYFERGLVLDSSIQPGLIINGSRAHIKQVMDILLDNALKYSSDQGEVRVNVRRHGIYCRLSVTNPGTEIPQSDLERIFKRFYRADKARSRDGSLGLGLPIAMSIVAEHKGRIWAESGNGSNTFYVDFPILRQL